MVSGLVKYFKEDELLGKKVVLLCNLKPVKMRGKEDQLSCLLFCDFVSVDNIIFSCSKCVNVQLHVYVFILLTGIESQAMLLAASIE